MLHYQIADGCNDFFDKPTKITPINKDRFFDIWNNKFKEFRENRAEKCEMCKNCSEKEFCNGDSMHTWDFDKNEPRLCVKNLI